MDDRQFSGFSLKRFPTFISSPSSQFMSLRGTEIRFQPDLRYIFFCRSFLTSIEESREGTMFSDAAQKPTLSLLGLLSFVTHPVTSYLLLNCISMVGAFFFQSALPR